MKKPQILRIRDKNDLKKVPTKFSSRISQKQIGKTLILTDSETNNVLTSKEVTKILKKLRRKEEKFVLVAVNLTVEATELLNANEIEHVCDRDFVWTDEQYTQRAERTHQILDEIKQRNFEERQANS